MTNQEQIPQQNQPEDIIPFGPAKQVGFNLEDVILIPTMREPFTISLNMHKEYLSEFWYTAKSLKNLKVSFLTPTDGIYGEVGVNIFRNAIGAHYLPYSSEYVAPPSIDIVRQWFLTIGYGEGVSAKGTLRNSLLPLRWSVNNWALKPNQPEGPPFTAHMLAICAAAKPVVFKAPKPLPMLRVSQGGSSKAPTGSKIGHLKRKKKSILAIDSNLSWTSASTPVVAEMHKEDKQATGDPKYLRVTSEERANPQLSSGYDASADSTVEADPRIYAPSDSIPQQQGMDKGIKNTSFDHISAGTSPHVLVDKTQSASKGLETDLAKLMPNVKAGFIDLDSLEDDPIIVVDESDDDEDDKREEVHTTSSVETKDASVPNPPSPSSLPTELKELPSKFNELTEEVKWLKKQVHELEIELPVDLKDIPTKLEDFNKTVISLASQVAELKTLYLLNKVTDALNHFAQVIASKKPKDTSVPLAGQAGTQPAEGEKTQIKPPSLSAEKESTKISSGSDDDEATQLTGSMAESSKKKKMKKFDYVTEGGAHIHLTEEQINKQKRIEEDAKAEADKQEGEVRKPELVDLLDPEVVEKYYNDKL
ncbi:hypothetical protein Tco_0563538 [Tanacetum coccineum]